MNQIDLEVLTTVLNLAKEKVTAMEQPGSVSRIKRLKAGELDVVEERELYQDYRQALIEIQDHCHRLLHDEDWKGNILA